MALAGTPNSWSSSGLTYFLHSSAISISASPRECSSWSVASLPSSFFVTDPQTWQVSCCAHTCWHLYPHQHSFVLMLSTCWVLCLLPLLTTSDFHSIELYIIIWKNPAVSIFWKCLESRFCFDYCYQGFWYLCLLASWLKYPLTDKPTIFWCMNLHISWAIGEAENNKYTN